MPLIHDPRTVASTGFFLGGLAFWVIRGGQRATRLGRVEGGAAARLAEHGPNTIRSVHWPPWSG
jgi:hypothetical protein